MGLLYQKVSADYVLAMTSVGDTPDGYERLEKALYEIDKEIDAAMPASGKNNRAVIIPDELPVMERQMSINDAGRHKKIFCSPKEAIGKYAIK